jgi:hypothetical protein
MNHKILLNIVADMNDIPKWEINAKKFLMLTKFKRIFVYSMLKFSHRVLFSFQSSKNEHQ